MTAPRLTHVFNLSAFSDPIAFPTSVNKVCNLYPAPVEGGLLSTADNKTKWSVINAADWMTMASNESGIRVDARICARDPATNTGLDLQYHGKLHFGPELMEVFQGKKSGTEFGEGYYYTAPEISSRDKEWEWVNECVFLGQGKIGVRPDGKLEVSYRIYKVE